MGKQTDNDAEFVNSARRFTLEASNIALDAFHEGYLMGIKQARKIYNGEDEDNENQS